MTTTRKIHPDDVRIVPEMELCDRLRRALRILPMDNAEIAHVLGVKPPTISTWLTGRRTPSHAALMIMADMTGVDLQWLETGTASPEAGRSLYAIRDSNPEPADSEGGRVLRLAWGVNRGLSADRRGARGGRHLWAVS